MAHGATIAFIQVADMLDALRGLGAFVAWAFATDWEAAVGLQFEHRRFRLDAGDAIGEDKSVPVYVRMSWEMLKGLSLDAMAGAAFGGEVELNDSDDHFIGDRKYEVAPLVGLRLRYALAGL